MDAALAVEKAALALQEPMNAVIGRGDSAVQQFYCGATVFLTGGSGFIGKQLIEKLFRSCKIKKIYMLLRSKKGKAINERLLEVLHDPIFETLRKNQPGFEERLVPIEGDVAQLGLGIDVSNRQVIIEEVEIIFHVAATIAFEEPLRSATLANVRGTREMISLARVCKRLKSFLYMSTAYSHATARNSGCEVLEQFYPCPVSPELMIQLAESLEEDMLNNMKKGLTRGWPNTYSFTKALAEELIRTAAVDLPICVLRPTIVICCRRDPCPGWIDISSVYGPSGVTLGSIMGIIHALQARQEIKIDFVPADYVCNAAIVAAVTAAELPLKIYQVGSSCRNPITWGYLTNILKNSARKTLISERAMWYCFVMQTSNRWLYLLYRNLLQDIPAALVDGLCSMMKKPPRLTKIYSTINKMSSVHKFYTHNDWTFDDRNTLSLFQGLSDADKLIYHHDTGDVEWKVMILLWCVGLRKYIVKDGLKNTALGMKRQRQFKIATYVIIGVVIYFVCYLLCCLFNCLVL